MPRPRPLALALVVRLFLATSPAALANGDSPPSTPAPSPRRIACIGDSITEGAGLSNPALESYPARLQRLIGTNDLVRNYGVSGRTLLKKGDFPYWKEAAYTTSRAWNPDVVLIKLGSNDSKPQNWRHGTNFVVELEELVASYRSLPSQPRVILCTPAPVYGTGAFTISPTVVANEIAPAIRDLATRLNLEVLDFHERLANHREWFPDTVHPNTSGAAVMAALAFRSLNPTHGPPAPPTLGISRNPAGRAVVAWPADHAPFVLLNAPRPDAPATNWTVATPVPGRDGTTLRLTNTAAVPRFFRLWLP